MPSVKELPLYQWLYRRHLCHTWQSTFRGSVPPGGIASPTIMVGIESSMPMSVPAASVYVAVTRR